MNGAHIHVTNALNCHAENHHSERSDDHKARVGRSFVRVLGWMNWIGVCETAKVITRSQSSWI